jgi:DNA polymerase-3 subunit delta
MIVHYFANNPKENPITLSISSLYTIFSKLLTFHYLTDKSKNNVAAVLKIHPYFVKDYDNYAAKYSVSKTVQIITLLRTFDMKSKGYGDPGTDPGDLLKELVYRILHL